MRDPAEGLRTRFAQDRCAVLGDWQPGRHSARAPRRGICRPPAADRCGDGRAAAASATEAQATSLRIDWSPPRRGSSSAFRSRSRSRAALRPGRAHRARIRSNRQP